MLTLFGSIQLFVDYPELIVWSCSVVERVVCSSWSCGVQPLVVWCAVAGRVVYSSWSCGVQLPIAWPCSVADIVVCSRGVFQLHIISLVPMGEGGSRGAYLKDFKKGRGKEEEENSRGREQITTFCSKEKGCN